MRFNVLVALFVATFFASCSSFISAETEALNDNINSNDQVPRRLRVEDDDQEERDAKVEGLAKLVGELGKGDDIAAKLKEVKGLKTDEANVAAQLKNLDTFSKLKGVDKLTKKGITMESLMKTHGPEMEALTRLAIRGAKGKKGLFMKSLQYALMIAGVAGLFYVLYRFATKEPPNTTPDSTAISGRVNSAGA